MKSKDSLQLVVLGTVLGGVIGSVSALLLASKEGKKLRRNIIGKYKEFSEKAQNVYDDSREKYVDLVDKMREAVDTLSQESAKVVQQADIILDAFNTKSDVEEQENAKNYSGSQKNNLSNTLIQITEWALVASALIDKFKQRRKS